MNRDVARRGACEGLFVNAVDDIESASAYAGAVFRRAGVTVAISTDGDAPALAGLIREALEALLPDDLDRWMQCARESRQQWLAHGMPMAERRPLLLEALNELYRDRVTTEHGEQMTPVDDFRPGRWRSSAPARAIRSC